jgi:lysophospholipase L1-like esterase
MGKKLLVPMMALFTVVFTHAQQNDWAKFSRYSTENTTLKSNPAVVFMGNSITDNWSNRFDKEFFSRNNFVGRGISGQTTSEMLVRFRQDVINLKPKAVVLLCGINDIARNNGYIELSNVLSNIQSMTELAEANQINVILCAVLPCNRFSWRPEIIPTEEVVKLNELIKAYANSKQIEYVDYYSAMVDDKGGLPENLSQDGCHPTFEGYLIMEKLVVKAIQKTLNSVQPYFVSEPNI